MTFRAIDVIWIALMVLTNGRTAMRHLAFRGDWRYRRRFRRESRRPGFSMDEHLAHEYPALHPSLEGFTPDRARHYVAIAREIEHYCRCEEARHAVKSLACEAYPADWSGERGIRRELIADSELFCRRWG